MAAAVPDFLIAWVGSQSTDLAPLLTVGGSLQMDPWQAARNEKKPPRVTFFLVSGDRVRDLSGPMMVARQRWQIDCWGATPAQARQIARLFTGAPDDRRLDGYRGTLGGVTVQSCILADERDSSESLGPGSDAGNPCVSLDFTIAWNTV